MHSHYLVRNLLTCLVMALGTMPAAAEESLNLTDTVTLALDGPAVRLARQALATAQARIDIAAAPLSLHLAAGYTGSWSKLHGAGKAVTSDFTGDWSALELRASLNVIPHGPRFDQLQQAEISWQRAAGNLQAVRADAVAGAVRDHLNALRANEELQVLQLAVTEAQLRLEGITTQQQAGAANHASLLEAELALNQAENDLAAARQSSTQTLITLSARLGTPVQAVAAGGLESQPHWQPPLEPGAARLAQREDVLNAQLSLREAEISVAATRRDQLPQGSISLGLQTASTGSSLQLGASFDTRSFQPGLSLAVDPDSGAPGLPEGMTRSGASLAIRVEIPLDTAMRPAQQLAALTLASSEAQLQQVIATAMNEISNAQAGLNAASSGRELAGRLLQQAEATYEAAAERFELGLISPVELLSAERRAAENQLRFQRARDSELLARLTLARALALDPMEVLK